MTHLSYKLSYLKNLPHIQPPGATLFVTYRLVGSIPKQALDKLNADAEMERRVISEISDPSERERRSYLVARQLFGKWDAALDLAESGPHWLQIQAIAEIVTESLEFLNGSLYDMDTYCIMSNHVHVIFTPLKEESGEYVALSRIMHSLKSYTAGKANELLKRGGQFWQHESYDHIVRDEAELGRIRAYVLNNPVRAGLVETAEAWPWSYCKYW